MGQADDNAASPIGRPGPGMRFAAGVGLPLTLTISNDARETAAEIFVSRPAVTMTVRVRSARIDWRRQYTAVLAEPSGRIWTWRVAAIELAGQDHRALRLELVMIRGGSRSTRSVT